MRHLWISDGGINCPKCGLDMTRIYSTVGLVFKGEGWGSKS